MSKKKYPEMPGSKKHISLSSILLIFIPMVFLIQLQCVNKRSSPDSSAICITVKYLSENRFIKSPNYTCLSTIYFIKVNNNNSNLYSQNDFLLSNYPVTMRRAGENTYLLNAEPGRYAAIGGKIEEEYTRAGGKHNDSKKRIRIFFFPKEMIPLTVVDLRPSEFKHMGTYTIKHKGEPKLSEFFRIRNADSAQMHYCRLIKPGSVNPSAGSMTSGFLYETYIAEDDDETVYAAKMTKHDNSRKAEIDGLRRAIRELSSTDWPPLIHKALQ